MERKSKQSKEWKVMKIIEETKRNGTWRGIENKRKQIEKKRTRLKRKTNKIKEKIANTSHFVEVVADADCRNSLSCKYGLVIKYAAQKHKRSYI